MSYIKTSRRKSSVSGDTLPVSPAACGVYLFVQQHLQGKQGSWG